MSAKYRLGFTIIETMLFLAITGVMVVALLAGSGASINIQRYHDSVQSLKTALQDQYSEVINVRNEVPALASICDTEANIIPEVGAPSRGQGDCVLLGRYITTTDNKTLKMSAVVGYTAAGAALGANDLTTLQAYKYKLVPTTSENYTIEWGEPLVKAGGTDPLAFSVLILRSPSSGAVRTFIDPTQSVSADSIRTLVEQPNLNPDHLLKACVDTGGLLGTKKMAVTILAGASSASGVEILGDASSAC